MNEQSRQVLELMNQPVFLVREEQVVWRNSSAKLFVDEGTALSQVLGCSLPLFELWTREDTLLLSLLLCGEEFDGSARVFEDGVLFIAERRLPQLDAAAEAAVHASACLRKPLHTMLSAARELFDVIEDDPNATKSASQLNQAMYQLLRLCGQMSDGGMLLQQQLRAHRELTELKEYFDNLEAQLRPLVEAAGLRLEYIGPKKAVTGWIDPDLIERAVHNLFANAMHYTPRGGTITLSAQQRGRIFAVTVRDEGEGISAKVMPHLFEHFNEPLGGDSRWGIGLGLTIVREVARLHGGSSMLSCRGESAGTTALFSFSLEPLSHELRSPNLLRYDYCSGLHHSLVELSEVLPAEEYNPANIL